MKNKLLLSLLIATSTFNVLKPTEVAPSSVSTDQEVKEQRTIVENMGVTVRIDTDGTINFSGENNTGSQIYGQAEFEEDETTGEVTYTVRDRFSHNSLHQFSEEQQNAIKDYLNIVAQRLSEAGQLPSKSK